VELSADLPALSALRSSLRSQTLASPLMNAPRFTRNLEAAYRRIWQQWCRSDAAL
jgi:predicted O-linked N-acetylglucosamine transferase (SPINDLY family)